MSKRVRVTLDVDTSFISLLNANIGLSGGMNSDKERDVAGVLAVVFLMEARGAFPEQVHAAIPHKWRPHIEAVSDMRQVTEAA